MGTLTRVNQSLLKLDQAILSLLTEFKQTKASVDALSNLLDGLIDLRKGRPADET